MKTKLLYVILFLCCSIKVLGQNNAAEFSFNEFLGYVKKYHPLVKQADLKLNEAQANLMQARGAFDPKIEVDFKEKEFKGKEYYSLLNSSFKIPTWYGIELKAGFDNAEGMYVNPENTLPNSGLTSFGVSVPVGQGLLINQRMADIRKAKIARSLNTAERNLQVVEVIYDAAVSYMHWKRSFDEVQLYETYLKNALRRYEGVSKLIEEGDKPSIDSVEAGIAVKTRRLHLEEAKLKLTKAKLELSNYVWLENNIPLELNDNLQPESLLSKTLKETLRINELNPISLDNHPKIKALDAKIAVLKVERKQKANSLLPKLDLSYHYLSEPSYIDTYRFEDYKIGLNFSFPVFLRKERAGVKLADLKIQDSEFGLQFERKNLENKFKSQQQEIISLEKQRDYNTNLVKDYNTLLNAEDRLFEMGESSLFIINSRENALIGSQINEIILENRYLNALLGLYKTVANPE
ncbi:outer membrane protein TolC [Flavobacterium cauense R2A-7]|uniref:Outer membrane protein TolC n=1 Tax=Flavobacterium cauense R2A-7 TaxID=1341154 RepID=A0A562LXK8_9FLAO|nr:TolC family protein [Flavobacterium cauense]KGO83752.1 transporter [Flavobacterium cauense R2A-7]TWI12370.1 outer membrane protein TolC [Flavobacterium cauense R2A-7]